VLRVKTLSKIRICLAFLLAPAIAGILTFVIVIGQSYGRLNVLPTDPDLVVDGAIAFAAGVTLVAFFAMFGAAVPIVAAIAKRGAAVVETGSLGGCSHRAGVNHAGRGGNPYTPDDDGPSDARCCEALVRTIRRRPRECLSHCDRWGNGCGLLGDRDLAHGMGRGESRRAQDAAAFDGRSRSLARRARDRAWRCCDDTDVQQRF
jgi:hypothetical protein